MFKTMLHGKKIKIAYFVPVFYEILFARFTKNFTGSLDKEKYEVCFVGQNIKKDFKTKLSKDVSISSLDFYAPIFIFKLPILFFKLIGYFKKEKPDIFVSSAYLLNIIPIMAKVFSGTKTKIILTEHNVFSLLAADAKKPLKRFAVQFILPYFMRIFYPMADAIVCVSKGVAEDIFQIIGRKDKVQVIYNPVFTNEIYGLAEGQVDHDWFLDPEISVILAAGRLVRQKDYPTLLRAFKIVLSKNSDCRLVILGEGILRQELENFASELGISEKVAFLGFVENQYKYIRGSSVFTLSSAHEGFGNPIVEAMALGTPIISTDCRSGPDEIIKNGRNGILVKVGDYNSLAGAILKVLENHSLRQGLCVEGKKRAKDFTFKVRVKEYENLFQKLTKNGASSFSDYRNF